jgi:hypothetical protein
MQNVNNTEAGSPPITTRNNVPAKLGQKGQSEDRPPDFLIDALLKLLGLAKQGSTESQGKSGELNGLGKESPNLPVEGESDKGIFLKEAGSNSSLISSFFLNIGKGLVTQSDQSLVDGAQASGKISGKGNFGLVNSTEESPPEGRGVKRSLDLKDGLNAPLGDNLILNKLKPFVEKIIQPLDAGPARDIANPEEGKLGLKNSIEHTSGKDDFSREGLSAEIIKVRPTQDRQSSNSIMIEKVEGEPSEKAKERQPGLSLFFKEGFFNDPRGPLAATNREKLEMTFDSDGLNNKDYFQHGEARQGKEASHTPNSTFNMTDYVLRDSMGLEKLMIDKPNPINHFPKSFDPDFVKDYYFTIKKQTSSSMEISLEPAGLGKLDIELKLTQDRLQGQIMVNDTAGKELIEKNLPQLLSDLTRGGLQIGGFTVSLKNQGRGQNPIPIPTDFEEPLLMPVSPEKIVPIQGNHLIHIII